MGDIGRERREVEFEPLTDEPVAEPAPEPATRPAPAPAGGRARRTDSRGTASSRTR